jgi:hypothetical protein
MIAGDCSAVECLTCSDFIGYYHTLRFVDNQSGVSARAAYL